MKLGIIGAGGYWGEKWVRNLKKLDVLNGICDNNDSKLYQLKSKFGLRQNDIIIKNNVDEFLKNKFDGIIISTPPLTHYEISKKALLQNNNVLVEKPLVINTKEGLSLQQIKEKNNIILMAGHTFIYHPAIRELKKSLNLLGTINRINIIRSNWGKYQEIGILYDLLPHDLSIVHYLLDSFPEILNGYVDHQDDYAFITYEIDEIICSSYLSWCSLKKERRLEIIGSEGIAEWNLDKEVINVSRNSYQKRINKHELLVDNCKVTQITYNNNEALAEEANHFMQCIRNKTNPITNIDHGIQITKLIQEFLEK